MRVARGDTKCIQGDISPVSPSDGPALSPVLMCDQVKFSDQRGILGQSRNDTEVQCAPNSIYSYTKADYQTTKWRQEPRRKYLHVYSGEFNWLFAGVSELQSTVHVFTFKLTRRGLPRGGYNPSGRREAAAGSLGRIALLVFLLSARPCDEQMECAREWRD